MTRFIIVRHGETAWNVEGREMGHQDSPLTSLGNFQARKLAERLASVEFGALYSSDLGRAVETARTLADECKCEVIFDPRLRERNMGIFEGLTRSEMESRFPEERAAYRKAGSSYVIPKGESADQRIGRALQCFDELAVRHKGGTVVVVTHGGILMGLFEFVLGLPFGSARRYVRANCAWNVFTRESEGWILETWGDVSHLELKKTAIVPKQSKDPTPQGRFTSTLAPIRLDESGYPK
jgi:2,3-bisphosphoglycerate-dependent phosphoglycerate mutase